MAGDVRPEDAEQARALIGTALRDGYAALATVTENDLCVLDAGGSVLVDAQNWARWMAFTDDQRALLRRSSVGVLCERKLLRPRPGAYVPTPGNLLQEAQDEPDLSRYDVAPELATALLARQRPVFVIAGTAVPAVPAVPAIPAPKMYGLADEDTQTLTVVLEQVFAKSYGRFGHEVRFMLMSVAKAVEALIAWMCVSPQSRWEPGHREVRVISNPPTGTAVQSWTATPVAQGWSVQVASSRAGVPSRSEVTGIVDDTASMGRLSKDLVQTMRSWAG